MKNIDLSFCIPTYNRAQIVHKLVTDILLCNDSNIEVVVLDNGSTDDTLSILGTIRDERFCVYSNGENKGALFNMVNVLNKGRGRYLVYSTDQDHIDYAKINGFKTFLLQQSNLAGGYCEFGSNSEMDFEIFPRGYQAVKKNAYLGHHPTGYFFNNELLRSIRLVERFSDYEFVDLFPLEFAFAELCLMGNGAIYHKPIFRPETGEAIVTKHKSSTTNGSAKKAFFTPESRLKMAVNYSQHINTLKLTELEKSKLMAHIFIQSLAAATFGYRSIMRNQALSIHYYMERREIEIQDLIIIGVNFYNQYSSRSFESSNFFKINIFNLYVMEGLIQKATRKLFKSLKLKRSLSHK